MSLLISGMFALFISLLTTATFASESGLRCSTSRNGDKPIECVVTADSVNIRNVVLNRGNCPSPIPTSADIAIAKAVEAKHPPYRIELLMGSNIWLLTQEGIAYSKYDHNPLGVRKFGDQIAIMNMCGLINKKIIEYSIDINGKNWTYSVQ